MSRLKWTAIYNDNTGLEQFQNGREHLFRDIDHNRLVLFILKGEEEVYSVNLKTGTINVGGNIISFPESYTKERFRLMFFVRVRETFTTVIEERSRMEDTYFGYQITHPEKGNVKRMFVAGEGKVRYMSEREEVSVGLDGKITFTE